MKKFGRNNNAHSQPSVKLVRASNSTIIMEKAELFHFRITLHSQQTHCRLSTDLQIFVQPPPISILEENIVKFTAAILFGFLMSTLYILQLPGRKHSKYRGIGGQCPDPQDLQQYHGFHKEYCPPSFYILRGNKKVNGGIKDEKI